VTLPTTDTIVTYPDGATSSTGTVQHVEPLGEDRSAVLLDVTAFHPVDTAWPDQPADRGVLVTGAGRQPIVDGVTGGIHEGRVYLGADLPVRTGTEGWTFVVAHVIDGPAPELGSEARVEVDQDLRRALSAGHTACHLAALALDAALAGAWTKPVPSDSLGSPAFDSLAIQTSRITPNGSVDVYRIGKSLRRKGFTPAAFDQPDDVAARANLRLAEWVDSGAAVRIERTERGLSARRTWVCDLPDASTAIPCGGTHVDSLHAFRGITVALSPREVEGGSEVTMTTTAHTA
jgi:alanyl-tRNA synthetase